MPRERQLSKEDLDKVTAAYMTAKAIKTVKQGRPEIITYQDDEPSAILLGFIVVLVAVCSFIGGCLTGTGYVRLYPILMGWLGQGG